jgi:hypothetical protein
MSLAALLLASLALWVVAVARAAWQAVRPAQPEVPGRIALSVRQRWQWRTMRRQPAAQSLRLARRLYVAVGSGGSLPRCLAVLIATEPEGPLRQALQIRLRHLQRRAPASRLPRWRGMPLAPCPRALRVLDDLLTGRATSQQALADWRIELLCSRVASCRAYHPDDECQSSPDQPAGAHAAGNTGGQRLQRSGTCANRRHSGAPSHRGGSASQ